MLFCESCRVKNNWTRSAAWPHAGVRSNVKCEVCGKIEECHDIPAIRLVPKDKMTFEQKTVDKIMQQGYHQKADSLVITFPNGRVWESETAELRKVFAYRNGEVDWYDTYELRVAIQNGKSKT